MPTQGPRLIEIACEAGVNTFDTANMHPMGLSEEVLGEALQGKRDDALVTSKGGRRWVRAPMRAVHRAITSSCERE